MSCAVHLPQVRRAMYRKCLAAFLSLIVRSLLLKVADDCLGIRFKMNMFDPHVL